MNIDIHAHIIPPELLRTRALSEEWQPRVHREGGRQLIDFRGRQIDSALREFVDPERIIEEQAQAGVDLTVLSPWASLFRYDAPVSETGLACRIQNDSLAEIAARHSGRLSALGAVPLQDPDAAVAELERVVTRSGMPGVEIGTHVNGTYLGAPELRPFWAAAEALQAFVLIHPIRGLGGPTMREHYLWNAFGNPAETALTAAHMIMSGLFEEHPRLKVCLVHGGGHLPYQLGRLEQAYRMRAEARQRLRSSPTEQFHKFYFDTVLHSGESLAFLVELVGSERVLLGSDYPFDMGTERPVAEVDRVRGLTDRDRQNIRGANAARVLNLAGLPEHHPE